MMDLIRYTAHRSNAKALSMLIAIVLSVAGIVMIFWDIRDLGFIDFKSPFMTGHVKSGFVGISLIFVSLCIIIAALFSRKAYRSITIEAGTVKVQCQIKSEEDLEAIRKLCKELSERNGPQNSEGDRSR